MATYYMDENGNLQVKSTATYVNTLNGTTSNVVETGTNGTWEDNGNASTNASTSETTGTLSNYVDIAYLNQDINGDADYWNGLVRKMMTTSMNGIEGIPYQFMPSVDSRLDDTGNGTSESKIGRKYAEKIMGRLPLLFLTPCKPQALADFSSEDKQRILTMVTEGNLVEDLVNGDGRYYNTTYAYPEYFRYFNCMMAAVSAFLGLYETKIPSYTGEKDKLIGEYDWSSELNPDFKTFFSAKENLVFYLDGFSSVSESFSNEVGESSIASQINETSATAQELNFLLAGNSSVLGQITDSVSEAVSSISSALTDLLSLDKLGGGIIGSLADSGVNSIVNGGKIVFPQIWRNSDYSRDYSLNIKLRSPDHDSLSIFLNVIKPYCKLLCLCLPRVMESEDHYNANAYMSPFLVKAFSKGMFNIDMGIITSLSVTKGAECQWNDDGLPTQLDIDITIADLYSSLAMSGFESTGAFTGNPFKAIKQTYKIVNNTAYMDFLANMAGLNVGTMAIGRRIKMYRYLTQTSVTQYPQRKFSEFERGISNFMGTLYSTF